MIEAVARIVPGNPATQLRLAVAEDEPFVKRLFKTARAADFTAAGLPPAMLESMLEQQYRAQAAGYAGQFPDAIYLIAMHRDEPVGRLILLTGDRRWHIIDIVLLPSARGQGIGSDLIEAVARAATHQGAREVVLSVLFSNAAARRLYARLGFTEAGSGVHVPMLKQL